MRGLDVMIVRFIPFILFFIVGWSINQTANGISVELFAKLHSNSAIYAAALFMISLSNKRYHCIYNRAMYALLIALPIFNYLDKRFIIVEDASLYLVIVKVAYYFTAILTSVLAIKHFIHVKKVRNERER